MRPSFPTVELHPVYEGPGDRYAGDIRNIILVGTERAAPSPGAPCRVLGGDTRRTGADGARPSGCRDAAAGSSDVVTGDVPLLTDGYAPTDALLIG